MTLQSSPTGPISPTRTIDGVTRTPPADESATQLIGRLVRAIPNWPETGVTFRDITPLLADPVGLRTTIDAMAGAVRSLGPVDKVIGVEARGFIFGPAVALALTAGFVPVRKAGKLPAARHSVSYALEYGEATVEMHVDAVVAGDRVLVVDDVLATGGTMAAVNDLVHLAGGEVVSNLTLIELPALGGRAKLTRPVIAIHTY